MSAEISPATPGRIAGVEVRSIDYVPLNERHGKVWSSGPAVVHEQRPDRDPGGRHLLGDRRRQPDLVDTRDHLRSPVRHVLHGVPLSARPAARAAADDPVASAVRLRGRAAGLGCSPTCSTRASTSSTPSWPATPCTRRFMAPASCGSSSRRWSPRSWRWSGYDLIHGVERWLTAGFLIIFGLLTIGVCTLNFPPGSFDLGGFKWTPFLIQFGAVAGYQISWAIYVSDYSRYLPPSVTVRKTFLWTYWGSALGAIWLMCLGSALAAWAASRIRHDRVAQGRR